MSSISELTVLTLNLGRINLLKENTIKAELPFCKQKNLIYTWYQATKWVCCCQLSESFTILCNEDLSLFLAQAFEETTHWHVPQRCPVTRWKKQGGSRSRGTKRAAASIDPRAEGATFLFAGWKSPRSPSSASLTFPVFLLVLPAGPLDSKVCNPLTQKQTLMLAAKPQSHEIKYLLSFLE